MIKNILLGASLCSLPILAMADIGIDGARHLLLRTGFGANPAQIAVYAPLSREAAVDKVLAATATQAVTPPPSWANDPFERPGQPGLTEEQKKTLQQERNQHAVELRSWWLTEMRNTPSPLTEKMTLFWHNHFVSALDKVRSPQMMYQQNLLLRHYALGDFGQLLHAVARDPAMMRYLDTANNRKEQPNENFAREVMELFTLGEGHYSEQDIREAARAFTGWGLDHDDQFIVRPRLRDTGEKTIFGQRGNFDGNDVIDLLLQQPATAVFVTNKLWRNFVSPTPDPATVGRLAEQFRRSHYQIKPLLRAMLLTPQFWRSQGQLVKSPVELTVGTLVTFDLMPADWRVIAGLNRQLGQDLFAPPNVKGWPGGEAWINSATLLTRKQFLDRIAHDAAPARDAFAQADGDMSEMAGREARIRRFAANGLNSMKLQPDEWAAIYHARSATDSARLLLALPPANPLPPDTSGAKAIAQLLLDPAYQVE
ncbi:DUF1800 domain-containing protein [Chromobacterium sphagni]|uniref:DUF1800 domain-containing protein n=1 Tax=Chromobacterium sphagni TaxID=1903179 RepID=A0ABX3CA71_9NEIS|nr:DUF1800 domain-containing protein [Chromobacterium sphagni]OHX19021.1 hypothetical protein BI344_10425 [Chromobacterium sphagni]